MSHMIDHFVRASDPYHEGDTADDLMGLGYPLTDGMIYPYPAGGVVLRRRRLYPAVGAWSFCGYARPNETTISQASGFTHEVSMGFQYASALVLGNGFSSDFCEPVRVDFDAGGTLITPALPMFPNRISVKTLQGGKYAVVWEYDPFGQGGWPTDFQVFEGATAAAIDYNTPLMDSVTGLSVVPFVGRRRRFEFTTTAYSDGSIHVFSVRARNAAGVTELNTLTTAPTIARAAAIAVSSIEALSQRRA